PVLRRTRGHGAFVLGLPDHHRVDPRQTVRAPGRDEGAHRSRRRHHDRHGVAAPRGMDPPRQLTLPVRGSGSSGYRNRARGAATLTCMANRQIPVVVVAGFLGAGKTTLLNHLLHNTRGARIGVIVNDFGAVNIDSMLVAGQVDSMVSLSNGCLCCVVDVSDLYAMLDRLAHRNSDLDVIVVEASGLAEPRNMIRLVLGSENEYITYGGLVL